MGIKCKKDVNYFFYFYNGLSNGSCTFFFLILNVCFMTLWYYVMINDKGLIFFKIKNYYSSYFSKNELYFRCNNFLLSNINVHVHDCIFFYPYLITPLN